MPITIACKVCDKEFLVKPSGAHRRRCCSKSCSDKYRSDYPNSIWVTLSCDRCGISFRRRHYRADESKKHFCSRQCSKLWMKEHVSDYYITLFCKICGKTFERQRYFVNVRKNAKFCSRLCLNQFNSINKRREKNINWIGGTARDYGPNWHQQQRTARKRDNYQCQICGVFQEKHRLRLDVHHIKPFRAFEYIYGKNENYIQANDLSNLVTLCRKCHKSSERSSSLFGGQSNSYNEQRH